MSIENPQVPSSDNKQKENNTVIAKSGFKPPEDLSHAGVDDKYLGEYRKAALKEMEDDIYQRITEATSPDEIEKLNNELRKTQESVAAANAKIEKLTPEKHGEYQQYRTKDAKKAAFLKNGVPDEIVEEAAQENLDRANKELDEVGAKIADLQTEKNVQALHHNSEAISRTAKQLKKLEHEQANLAQNQWQSDWGIKEDKEKEEEMEKVEEMRTLSNAEFLAGNAQYDKEKGDRLELTSEQIENARAEMNKSLEERMKDKKAPALSPEEIAKISKERNLIEAELIKHGAKYIVGENGERRLVLTKEQISQASKGMNEEMKKTSNPNNKENSESTPTVAKVEKPIEGKTTDTSPETKEAKPAIKRELPGWLKTIFEGIGGLVLIAFAALFGSLEKQIGKKKSK